MNNKLVLLLTCLIMSSHSYSARYLGYYTCGDVIDANKNNNEWMQDRVSKWFQGFYTGMNYGNTGYETDNPPSKNSIYYATIKYCNENPLKDTSDAAIYLYDQLTEN